MNMDPFTQRMLERARARQEKIDQKLASSGQKVPKRKPLSENAIVTADSPVKSPAKPSRDSRSSRDFKPSRDSRTSNDFKSNRDSIQSPRKEILSPKKVTKDSSSEVVTQDMSQQRSVHNGLRPNVKSRLDRMGVLYSDKGELSSPIYRREQEFTTATPPAVDTPRPQPPPADGKRKFGRLAALADTINSWEDDLSHPTARPEPAKKATKTAAKALKDESTLDVSIHSLNDINTVLQSTSRAKESPKSINTRTFTKPAVNEPFLNKNIVAELESQGYQCVTSDQWRLVYDFTTTETADPARQEPSASTPSAAPAPDMATMVASNPPTVAKKPSIKKYRAPTPPRKIATSGDNNCESDKDKENNVLQCEVNDNEASESCVQTKPEGKEPEKGSPVVKRLAPKLNGNVDRNSVLSKAAMFEAGSPRAKDPAEMSLRERKALFEKNKGSAIVPKAPFGMAPSAKSLHGDIKEKPKAVHTPQTKPTASRVNSKENIPDDNVSQTSIGGGIKGKLAALFSKEQTISETTIANKNKQERNKEMEMLQNRFNYKAKPEKPTDHDSDDEQSEHDPSERAPLMGSTLSLTTANKKPEIIANVPKVTFEQAKSQELKSDDVKREDVVATQPGKRRSSQDSPVVLSVLDDVKRIKVNNNKDVPANGTVTQQPASLYPHLSDIETDTSHTQDEYSDCGGSSEDNLNDNPNKSDNWAETSFGREVMNVVKKNNSSYNKAVRETDSETSVSDMNSELDDCLDEALNEEESEGPTPPKINKKGNTLSSKSFTYEEGSPVKKQFKSPLKMQPPTPATPRDRGNELVHSVSFYRRMQNASSQPTTPLRTIRHASPEREPATPDGPAAVTTVRRRIKELHNEINKQQTVISQASQALNLCASTVEFSGSTEQAEGERLLLLATHRRQACLHEVQRLQVEGAGPAAAAGMASLHIQGVTAPLRRDYARALHADDATGHYAVCLLKCRDRVLATSMQLTQAPSTSLHFPDEIRMEGLASDFKVTIEVYLLPATKELLPHNVKYHITNKKSNSKLLTPKSKVSELKAPRVQSPGGPLTVRSPQFQPHGYCIFALPQATRDTFTLNKVPAGSPLEGTLQLRIRARVLVPPPAPHAAFLTAFDDVSGLGAWHRRWFSLQPPRLTYWKYPDDVSKKMPIGDIDLTTVTSEKVSRAPRDLCARPNTLLLESTVPPGLIVPDGGSLVYFRKPDGTVVRRHLLAADTPKDRDEWLESLNKALEYVRCCKVDEE